MSESALPACHCGAESFFYCEADNIYFCSQHLITHNLSHQTYFYANSLKKDHLDGLIQSLHDLKSSAENKMQALASSVSLLYQEIDKVYQVACGKIQEDLQKIMQMIAFLQQNTGYVPNYPIFLHIQQNEQRVFNALPHRLDVKFNEKEVLHEIQKFVNVVSTIDEIFTFTPNYYGLDHNDAMKINNRYENMKKAQNLHSPSQYTDELADWIKSMDCRRNLDHLNLLCLDGAKLDSNIIDAFAIVPQMFPIKKFLLSTFNSTDFEHFVDSVTASCSNIQNFQCENSEIESSSALKLATIFSKSDRLKEVMISNCQNGDHITNILEYTSLALLKTLVLSKNLIGDSGIGVLCRLFPRMLRLEYLHLDNNAFGPQGGLDLVIHLKCLGNLIELNLSSNNIGSVVGEIFQSLVGLQNIAYVDISSTNMEASQEPFITDSIVKMPRLECLVFDMTISENFLINIKQLASPYCHIYKDNPEQSIRLEFKG